MILLVVIRLVKPLIMKPRSPRSVLKDLSSRQPVQWRGVVYLRRMTFPPWPLAPPRETCGALGPNTSPRTAGYPEMG